MIRGFIVIAFAICFSVNAYSQVPFECDSNFHQTFGDNNELLSYDVRTNTFVVAPNSAGFMVNAFGLRVADGFAYGLNNTTPVHLFRLGSDGTVVDLGSVTDLPDDTWPSGDFKDDLLYAFSRGLVDA
jgi:hypothetical protein